MNRIRTSCIALTTVVALLGLGPASAQEDWSSERTTDRQREIIDRYQRILERRPVEGPVLDRLIQAVGSGFEGLVAEYEARVAAEPGEANLAVLLGHLYKHARRYDEAIGAYRAALAAEPDGQPDGQLDGLTAAVALRGLADALYRAGRADEATAAYERALAEARHDDEREEILFALTDLSLANRQLDAAVGYMEQLVALDARDVYVREQLAQTLVDNGLYDEAIAQYEAIVERAGRDTRQRAMALGSIGDVLAEQGQLDAAVERYREAQGLVTRGSWLFVDLERRIVDAFRVSGDLESLVAYYEERWSRPSFEQMRILVELYEELGRLDDALEMAGRAVRANRRSVDARLDRIRLLERAGDIEAVIREYEEVINLSDEPVHGLRLAEIHRQRGDQGAGMAVMARLERAYRSRPSVLRQLAERFIRWGDRERAVELYERLTELEPTEAEHWVMLGDLLYMNGQREAARATWERIPEAIGEGAEADAVLGRVYASHGLMSEAIALLERSVEREPERTDRLATLAEVYEQASRWDEALATWERVVAAARAAGEAADARSRVVSIYDRLGLLPERIDALAAELESTGDREVGYLLGQAYLTAGDLQSAELVFASLLEANQADTRAIEALARIAEADYRLGEAIELYERLADADPAAADDASQRIIDLSLRLFDVQRAISVANRVVEANRNDARSYANLGRIYRDTRRLERAAAAFEEAVRLDRRATDYLFELADVYVALGRDREAEQRFRDVVAESRVESEVVRAGRRAVQLAAARNELEPLLADWSRLIYRAELAPAYRRLVVEGAEALTEPIVGAVRFGTPAEREAAEGRLGELATALDGPLLMAATDGDGGLAVDALSVVGLLGSGRGEAPLGSAPGQLLEALRRPQAEVRVAAAVALGGRGDVSSAEGLTVALTDGQPEVRAAAAWALGELGNDGAVDALLALLDSDGTARERALAAYALGRLGDARAVDRLLVAASAAEAEVRQAVLWSLGVIGDGGAAATLRAVLDEDGGFEGRLAAWGLSRLPASPEIVEALLRAWWRAPEGSGAQIGAALSELGAAPPATVPRRAQPHLSGEEPRAETLIRATLAQTLSEAPRGNAALIVTQTEAITRSLRAVLAGRDELARQRALDDLAAEPGSAGEPGPGLGPLTGDSPSGELQRRRREALDEIARGIAGEVAALVDASAAEVRARAAAALRSLGPGYVDEASLGALREGLEAADAGVRRESAAALGVLGDASDVERLDALLDDGTCSVRGAAAEAMARLGADGAALSRVTELVRGERCRLARAQAVVGLALGGGEGTDAAGDVLRDVDRAGRLDLVAALADHAATGSAGARRLLERLAQDADEHVRRAATAALGR